MNMHQKIIWIGLRPNKLLKLIDNIPLTILHIGFMGDVPLILRFKDNRF